MLNQGVNKYIFQLDTKYILQLDTKYILQLDTIFFSGNFYMVCKTILFNSDN